MEDAGEPGCFAFRHALTRDTIVDGVLAMHARAMHLLIAREIEREPDRDGRVVELAEHYWRAAAFSECAAHAQTAGDVAKARHAYAEAAELYERSLACGVADQHGLVVLHEKAASAYASLGAPQKVLDHLDVAVAHYTATGELDAARRGVSRPRAGVAAHRADGTRVRRAARRRRDERGQRKRPPPAQERRAARADERASRNTGTSSKPHLRAAEPLLAIAGTARCGAVPHVPRGAAPRATRARRLAARLASEPPTSRGRTATRRSSRSPSPTTASTRARSRTFDDAAAAFREVIDIGRTHAGSTTSPSPGSCTPTCST